MSIPETYMKHVVFDLDGTLADLQHRLHFIEQKPKDWPAFFNACVRDEPIWPNIVLLNTLHDRGRPITILSGRNESVRPETEAWLAEYGVDYDRLIMRPARDFRADHILKRELADKAGLAPGNTLGIFDDRASVVEMWRELGFHVWQVARGDF